MAEVLTNVLNEILKVEGIEESFSCSLVHRPNAEKERVTQWQQELNTALRTIPQEQQDAILRQYLNTALTCAQSKLQLLMELLETMVRNGIVGARLVCEVVMNFDKLQYTNARFWVECFRLVRKIIDLVEYKGVREIMKVCSGK